MFPICFNRHYTLTVALNPEGIKKNSQRVTKNELFLKKYNWDGINFPPEKDDQKKF